MIIHYSDCVFNYLGKTCLLGSGKLLPVVRVIHSHEVFIILGRVSEFFKYFGEMPELFLTGETF